ncbi:hypothetical protein LG299_12600 [Microbacterium lacus]|uniref:hypothetical protein n=1 Tax=Microbacterium lacus TaxID=415217 RepID=UPI00384F3087
MKAFKMNRQGMIAVGVLASLACGIVATAMVASSGAPTATVATEVSAAPTPARTPGLPAPVVADRLDRVPVVAAPVGEAPIVETPVTEAPVVETPAAGDTTPPPSGNGGSKSAPAAPAPAPAPVAPAPAPVAPAPAPAPVAPAPAPAPPAPPAPATVVTNGTWVEMSTCSALGATPYGSWTGSPGGSASPGFGFPWSHTGGPLSYTYYACGD